MPCSTPVLFCLFNRPAETVRVFEAIRRQRPPLLLVAQDGPRPDHRDDPPQIEACRRVLERVDWPCEVRWNCAESNLGCRHRMATAISWGFAQSERLIILEDDCLPADSFFPFCEQLLEHYADEPRVMLVSGNHFQPRPRGEGSYYFSKFAHIWGWASWRRAWKGFDLEMNAWEAVLPRNGRSAPGAAAKMSTATGSSCSTASSAAKSIPGISPGSSTAGSAPA